MNKKSRGPRGGEADARGQMLSLSGPAEQALQVGGGGGVYSRQTRNLAALAAIGVQSGTTRYDLPAAVTIPDKSATMVMLLDQRVPGESLALYAPDGGVPESSSHPFRVARFTNKTGGLLERGPLAIFSDGSFVGQGMTDPLPDGATATVPFAHRAPRGGRGHARDAARKGRASTTSRPAA